MDFEEPNIDNTSFDPGLSDEEKREILNMTPKERCIQMLEELLADIKGEGEDSRCDGLFVMQIARYDKGIASRTAITDFKKHEVIGIMQQLIKKFMFEEMARSMGMPKDVMETIQKAMDMGQPEIKDKIKDTPDDAERMFKEMQAFLEKQNDEG